ncbi:hypothetical protein Barb4_04058 [Bacteroidales bacterium Barb4]|nr:hypothetical protein Barb4_04058 [Bacteroidales bacterium Barb4]
MLIKLIGHKAFTYKDKKTGTLSNAVVLSYINEDADEKEQIGVEAGQVFVSVDGLKSPLPPLKLDGQYKLFTERGKDGRSYFRDLIPM